MYQASFELSKLDLGSIIKDKLKGSDDRAYFVAYNYLNDMIVDSSICMLINWGNADPSPSQGVPYFKAKIVVKGPDSTKDDLQDIYDYMDQNSLSVIDVIVENLSVNVLNDTNTNIYVQYSSTSFNNWPEEEEPPNLDTDSTDLMTGQDDKKDLKLGATQATLDLRNRSLPFIVNGKVREIVIPPLPDSSDNDT